MNEDLIARLRAIQVPTKEEALARSRDSFGLLFGEGCYLKYLDFAKQEINLLAIADNEVRGITAHNNVVHFSDDSGRVYSLDEELMILMVPQLKTPRPLCSYDNRLLLGPHSITSFFDGQELVPESSLGNLGIRYIDSLFVSPAGDLYALIEGPGSYFSTWSLSKDYSFKAEIIEYSQGEGGRYSQAACVPFGSFEGLDGKEYDFSILSCANVKFLDINDEPIKGTEVQGFEIIERIAILDCSGSEVDVVYSGQNLNTIMRAKIDLKKREVIGDVEKIISPTPRGIYGLCSVQDYDLHEKLRRYELDE